MGASQASAAAPADEQRETNEKFIAAVCSANLGKVKSILTSIKSPDQRAALCQLQAPDEAGECAPLLKLKLVPVPVCQAPPSTRYCHTAPDSIPVTLTVAILVMPSLVELPESVAKVNVNAATDVSSVKDLVVKELTLPAVSVCRAS